MDSALADGALLSSAVQDEVACVSRLGGQMLSVSQAVSMPAHARVNSQCYPVWNDDMSDLQVVWDGRTCDSPFAVGYEQRHGGQSAC